MQRQAVSETVKANADWVPPAGKGSFYLRPLLFGDGPILGLGPAPSYTLVVYGAAVSWGRQSRPRQQLRMGALRGGGGAVVWPWSHCGRCDCYAHHSS